MTPDLLITYLPDALPKQAVDITLGGDLAPAGSVAAELAEHHPCCLWCGGRDVERFIAEVGSRREIAGWLLQTLASPAGSLPPEDQNWIEETWWPWLRSGKVPGRDR